MPPKPKALPDNVLEVARLLADDEARPSRAKLARRLGMVESTLSKALHRAGMVEAVDAILRPPPTPAVAVDDPGVHHHADGSATIASDFANQPPAPWKPDTLLRAHGLDPAEWEIVRVRGNRWGDPSEPMHQLRVDVVPRRLLIIAPDPSDWKPPPKPRRRRRKAAEPRSVVVCGDHHAPHHDKVLHRLFCEWLADERPDEGVINGDLLDFHTISRHRERDGFAQPVNECLRAGLQVLLDYRAASPDTRWTIKRGNHDQRLYDQIVDNVRGLHRLAPGGGLSLAGEDDEIPALSLRRLLYLDQLGIELIDEDWDVAKVRLSRKLSARHGPSAAKNATAKLLDKFSVSVIQSHTHRLSIELRTEHTDADDEPTITRLAAEAGCMCEVRGGLGYADSPNWNQGALAVTIWPDDDFHVSPLVYVPGRLLAHGRRYVAKGA